MVSSDEELLSLVRVTVGATNATDIPTSDLRRELADAKEEISREVEERLSLGGVLDFYNEDAPKKALIAMMFLRGRAVKRGKGDDDQPRKVASMRRHNYADDDERFWRDELVRHLNRISENK